MRVYLSKDEKQLIGVSENLDLYDNRFIIKSIIDSSAGISGWANPQMGRIN